MVVPTLPVIGVPPSIVLFIILQFLAVAVVYVLFIAAAVSTAVLLSGLPALLYCICNNSRTTRQCGPGGCCSSMKTAFLFVGRLLCVHTFPALFKVHKTRSGRGSQTREFMVFLDRKVESSLALIAAFCSIVYSIFCTSTMVFFRYFPVEGSGECFEKDNHGRSLFCYSNSRLPVDCANYSVTELRKLRFDCYAIAIPTGFGIAVAAALGLAKVAIVSITIFVKVTEGYFKMTKNPPQKLRKCCCRKLPRICANKIYIHSSYLLLLAVSIISFVSMIAFVIVLFRNETFLKPLDYLYYCAYIFLPTLICGPLIYIVKYLEAHCDREEYVSFAADQRPLDPRDWDMESGSSVTAGQQDEAGTGGASGVAPNETEESVLIDTRGNTEYTEFGATQV